jgi:tetratricopeptide (TPR) repeat protein
LVDIYLKVGDVKQAEILSMEAVEGKVPKAYLKLGNVFYKRKLYKRAEEAYLKSVDLGETRALANLGVLFSNKRNPDLGKAKLYFEKAIEAGVIRGYNLLGKFYLKKLKDQNLGVQTLQKGVENRDPESAHTLAHFFERKGEYEKSDNLFINSFEWGKHSALLCLIDTIYMNGRRDKSQFALDILESNINMIKSSFAGGLIMYSKILLWNNKIEKSLETFKDSYGEINDVLKGGDNDFTDSNIRSILENVSEYILLLLAKEQYNICFSLFKDDSDLDFKMLLKPFYFVMMENFKDEYPSEYLKAGDELKETIGEIKNHIQYLKNNVVQ